MKKYAFLFLVLSLISVVSLAQVLSDFEAGDTDNWHSEGDGDYYWEAATGNPGGCFRVDDDATGDWNNAFTPVKFLGNWSAATTTDYLTADIFLHPISTSYGAGIFVFQIKGPGGVAKAFIGSQPPFDTWTTYTAYLDPANWTMVSGDWNLLLQQVNEVIVRAEYIQGDEYNRIDNVALSFTPVVIPVDPVICSDFEDDGYDGWSFSSTGGVSNNTTGGNPGRCIRITDGSSISMAYPPPKFLGDWTLLDIHAAEILVDIKITNHSGTTLISDYFLKISGPGGTAEFPMDNSVEDAFDQYKTFNFPVDENYWTVTSGTWLNLIDHINSFEMVVEFIDGSEIVWMDNFCIADLPPATEFIAHKLIAFPGEPIQFTDLSTGAPSIWDWDFDNGQTSTLQNPQIVYNSDGIYDVSLTATNTYGPDTETKLGYIEILDDSECLKYEDDFEDDLIYPVWDFVNGTWVESSGIMRQTSNYYISGNYLGASYALVGSHIWQDYVIECDIKATDDDGIGFVFNYVDDQNMYMFHWNAQANERLLIKWENGSQNILASDATPYLEDTWYNIEIETISGNIFIYINGLEIFNVVDNTFGSGKAGLYCWANDESHFDNFKVSCFGIQVDLLAYLEGPFQSTEMTTDLNINGMIPLAQPYSNPPWNFNSLAQVSAIPNPDVCDWVLIELRDAADASSALPSTIVGQKPGFILNDGSIVGLDGENPIRFGIDIQNQLYAVVYHRNHLPIMSAIPLTESGGLYTYNFTTSANQAYAENQDDLGGGYFGMIGGNANADAIINELDGIQVWYPQAGESGYLPGDANLDGQTDNPDKNNIWLKNYGQYEQLPGTGFVGCGTNIYDDRDGKSYGTVQIGDQCWMAENLNIGNMINGFTNPTDNGIIEKYCINNISSNCESNGGLYLWDELMEYSSVESSQGICPDGWHVPSNAEWCSMEQILDPTVVCDDTGFRGTDIGTQLKEGGTSGFEALLTGERTFNGEFNYINFRGIFWTSTEIGFLSTIRFVQSNDNRVYRWTTDQIYGFNVRCVLD